MSQQKQTPAYDEIVYDSTGIDYGCNHYGKGGNNNHGRYNDDHSRNHRFLDTMISSLMIIIRVEILTTKQKLLQEIVRAEIVQQKS